MSEKTEFAARLKAALITAGHEPRPSVVEKNFNLRYWGRPVTFQAARHWLRGESIPEQDKLVILAEWLDIDPHVLRYGAPSSRKARSKHRGGLSSEEHGMIEVFLTLSASQRKAVRDMVLVLAEANGKKPPKSPA